VEVFSEVMVMNELNKLLFKPYQERLFELVQDYFVPMYNKIDRKLWNNQIYASVKRPYYTTLFEYGIAEYYIPTTNNVDGGVQYYRVAFAVVPKLDEGKYENACEFVKRPLSTPPGKVDSTTIFVVGREVTEEHKRKVREQGKKAMLKIKQKGDCFCIPIVAPSPEVAFRKIMKHISHFWDGRVKAFLEKLGVQPWIYGGRIKNLLALLRNNTIKVIERVSETIKHSLESMVAHLVYFMDGLSMTQKLIAKLNMAIQRVHETAKQVAERVSLLNPFDRERVLAKLQECLIIAS